MVIGRRSLLLAGVAVPAAAASARAQCVTDTPGVDACRGGVRITQPPGVTLDLSFFGPTLDARLTFTRASTATYFDSSGVMQTAAMNLVLNSGDITAATWVLAGTGGATVPTRLANQTTAPDGTLTAGSMTMSAVSVGTAGIAPISSFTATVNPYTLSVWLRGSVGGEKTYVSLTADGISYYRTAATLTTSWQRFVLTTPALTAATWFAFIGTDRRDAAGQPATLAQTFYIWGGQLEIGSAATSYIPTTTAANGAPRFDYDPVTHAALGLLVEEQRTNVLLQTRDISNAVWSTAGGAGGTAPLVTANQGVSPDGTTTAARAAYASASSGMIASIYQSVTATAAQYTFSVYLRGVAGGEQIYIYLTDGASAYPVRQRVTLTTAWQRFVITSPSNLTAAAWYSMIGTDLRDGGQTSTPAGTMFIWGAQLELGTFPTSYIPTTAAAVTRSQDQCSILPAGMGFYTSPGGSWMAEFINQYPAPVARRVLWTSAPSSPTPMYIDSTYPVGQFDTISAVNSSNTGGINVVQKAATTWVAGSAKDCLNGGAVATSAALTTGYPTLAAVGVYFLQGNLASESLTGYIRRVRYWPRVLSNAELQSVTR